MEHRALLSQYRRIKGSLYKIQGSFDITYGFLQAISIKTSCALILC